MVYAIVYEKWGQLAGKPKLRAGGVAPCPPYKCHCWLRIWWRAWCMMLADSPRAIRHIGTQQRVRHILYLRRQGQGWWQRLLPRHHPHPASASVPSRRMQHHRRRLRYQGIGPIGLHVRRTDQLQFYKLCSSELEKASTHKSTKTHAGTGFVTFDLDLWPPKSTVLVLIVEYLSAEFGDPSCIGFWDITRKKTDGKRRWNPNPLRLPSAQVKILQL